MRLRRGGTPQCLSFFGSLVPTPASRGNSVPRPGQISAHHATGSRSSPCCQKRTFANRMENFLARFAIGTVIHPWFSENIIPVRSNCHLSLGERRFSCVDGWC